MREKEKERWKGGEKGKREKRKGLTGQTCGQVAGEVGPGYDRFAWLGYIRQIHGSRSGIAEIPPPVG